MNVEFLSRHRMLKVPTKKNIFLGNGTYLLFLVHFSSSFLRIRMR